MQSDWLKIDSLLNEQIWADLSSPSLCEAELTLLHINKQIEPICHRVGWVIYRLLQGHTVRYLQPRGEYKWRDQFSISSVQKNWNEVVSGNKPKTCSDLTGCDMKTLKSTYIRSEDIKDSTKAKHQSFPLIHGKETR